MVVGVAVAHVHPKVGGRQGRTSLSEGIMTWIDKVSCGMVDVQLS